MLFCFSVVAVRAVVEVVAGRLLTECPTECHHPTCHTAILRRLTTDMRHVVRFEEIVEPHIGLTETISQDLLICAYEL